MALEYVLYFLRDMTELTPDVKKTMTGKKKKKSTAFPQETSSLCFCHSLIRCVEL